MSDSRRGTRCSGDSRHGGSRRADSRSRSRSNRGGAGSHRGASGRGNNRELPIRDRHAHAERGPYSSPPRRNRDAHPEVPSPGAFPKSARRHHAEWHGLAFPGPFPGPPPACPPGPPLTSGAYGAAPPPPPTSHVGVFLSNPLAAGLAGEPDPLTAARRAISAMSTADLETLLFAGDASSAKLRDAAVACPPDLKPDIAFDTEGFAEARAACNREMMRRCLSLCTAKTRKPLASIMMWSSRRVGEAKVLW